MSKNVEIEADGKKVAVSIGRRIWQTWSCTRFYSAHLQLVDRRRLPRSRSRSAGGYLAPVPGRHVAMSGFEQIWPGMLC